MLQMRVRGTKDLKGKDDSILCREKNNGCCLLPWYTLYPPNNNNCVLSSHFWFTVTLSRVFLVQSTQIWFPILFFWWCPGSVQLAQRHVDWLFWDTQWGNRTLFTARYLNHSAIQLDIYPFIPLLLTPTDEYFHQGLHQRCATLPSTWSFSLKKYGSTRQ